MRKIVRFGLPVAFVTILVGLTACGDPVVSFAPARAVWTKQEIIPIAVKAVLAKAKFRLTADAYTDNAYFKKESTTCKSGETFETGVGGKEECNAKIELNAAFKAGEKGHLVVEGVVEVSGKVYEGKEKSVLET
jgi:hypothetical protein